MSYNNDYPAVLKMLEQKSFCNFISTVTTLDAHTTPYTLMFGDFFNKVHWIPMDQFTDDELNHQIACFLAENNVKITIDTNIRLNKSPDLKKQIFKRIEEIFVNTEPPAELGTLFANDVKFYNNLLRTYATL